MTSGTFYHDGYRDAIQNTGCNPPDVPVYRVEYLDGFTDAQQAFTKHMETHCPECDLVECSCGFMEAGR